MSIKFVVGYDGSSASEAAIAFAMKQAKLCDASLVVAHVLEWSPYSFLTKQEVEERHRRRKEELSRAEESVMKPLIAKYQKDFDQIEGVIRYGNIVEVLMSITKDVGASQIFVARTGKSSFTDRVFGSVAGSLAAHADVPVTIIP